MTQILSVHSFRRGTGKTSTSANIASLLAAGGHRVGMVEIDLHSPGIHVLFGLEDPQGHTLNHYLMGQCDILETVYDLTGSIEVLNQGRLFLVPASSDTTSIMRILREGYDVNRLNEGLQKLCKALELDVLVLDTQAGLNDETVLAMAISDTIAILLRLDQQDFYGTELIVELARRLEVPRYFLVVNSLPPRVEPEGIRRQIRDHYTCEVVGLLPHAPELISMQNTGFFALHYPDHPITMGLHTIVAQLISTSPR